jgi:uncharacterized protein (DUF1501 family)
MCLSRRDFLKTAAVTAGALLVPPALAKQARAVGGEPVLVALFLRGAADGLNIVVPYGDPVYAQVRPTIAVPQQSLLDLDGFFGLPPALAPLLPIFQARRLAVVHAFGSPDSSRSHFDAQDFMERAAPNDFSVYDGWLNRYLLAIGAGESLSGVSLGGAKALALAGASPSLAFSSLAGFRLSGGFGPERRSVLESMYRSVSTTFLGRSSGELFQSLDRVAAIQNSSTVTYPSSGLGRALRDVAALIRADVGVRVVTVSAGGWDHHEREPENMAGVLTDLAAALAAFDRDLGAAQGRTLLVTMTEFGRTIEENGSAGTDHGHGSLSFVLGGGIRGGRVILKNGQWPGLATAQRFQNRDLAVTTDFRDLFAEILHRHMGLSALGTIFPRHAVSAANYPGLFA